MTKEEMDSKFELAKKMAEFMNANNLKSISMDGITLEVLEYRYPWTLNVPTQPQSSLDHPFKRHPFGMLGDDPNAGKTIGINLYPIYGGAVETDGKAQK